MRKARRDCAEESLNEGSVVRFVCRAHIDYASEQFTGDIQAIGRQMSPRVVKTDLPPARIDSLWEHFGDKSAALNRFKIWDRDFRQLCGSQRLLQSSYDIIATVLTTQAERVTDNGSGTDVDQSQQPRALNLEGLLITVGILIKDLQA
jgi:hypothetical protein